MNHWKLRSIHYATPGGRPFFTQPSPKIWSTLPPSINCSPPLRPPLSSYCMIRISSPPTFHCQLCNLLCPSSLLILSQLQSVSFIHSQPCFSGLYISYSFSPFSPFPSTYFHNTSNWGLCCWKRISRMKQISRQEEIQLKGIPAQTAFGCKSLVGLISKIHSNYGENYFGVNWLWSITWFYIIAEIVVKIPMEDTTQYWVKVKSLCFVFVSCVQVSICVT